MTAEFPVGLWARWRWEDIGLGRWHALARNAKAVNQNTGEERPVVILACGRVRPVPTETSSRPADDRCCPECLELDKMRAAYDAGFRTIPDRVADPVPALVGPNL